MGALVLYEIVASIECSLSLCIYTTLAIYSSPRSALFFFERPSAAVAGTFRLLSTVAPFRPFLK
jgi:hypothetical protein